MRLPRHLTRKRYGVNLETFKATRAGARALYWSRDFYHRYKVLREKIRSSLYIQPQLGTDREDFEIRQNE